MDLPHGGLWQPYIPNSAPKRIAVYPSSRVTGTVARVQLGVEVDQVDQVGFCRLPFAVASF